MLKNWHAPAARSTFVRQNVQNTSAPEAGAILQVAIRKNGAPLWREAHFQVKIVKN